MAATRNIYDKVDSLIAARWVSILKKELRELLRGVVDGDIRTSKHVVSKMSNGSLRIEISDSEEPSDYGIVYSLGDNSVVIRYRTGSRRSCTVRMLNTSGYITTTVQASSKKVPQAGLHWFRKAFDLPTANDALATREAMQLKDEKSLIDCYLKYWD